MGRITPKLVRKTGDELYNKYKDYVSSDFEQNKKLVGRVATLGSKKIRNILAGYLVRKVKKGDLY